MKKNPWDFQGVILDVCSLDQELTLLQQGCDITGGNYLKVPQLAGLLQYLLVYHTCVLSIIDLIVTRVINICLMIFPVGFPTRSQC